MRDDSLARVICRVRKRESPERIRPARIQQSGPTRTAHDRHVHLEARGRSGPFSSRGLSHGRRVRDGLGRDGQHRCRRLAALRDFCGAPARAGVRLRDGGGPDSPCRRRARRADWLRRVAGDLGRVVAAALARPRRRALDAVLRRRGCDRPLHRSQTARRCDRDERSRRRDGRARGRDRAGGAIRLRPRNVLRRRRQARVADHVPECRGRDVPRRALARARPVCRATAPGGHARAGARFGGGSSFRLADDAEQGWRGRLRRLGRRRLRGGAGQTRLARAGR